MVTICFEYVCKCAPRDNPDVCGCKPAGDVDVELVDNVSCAACGAELEVIFVPSSLSAAQFNMMIQDLRKTPSILRRQKREMVVSFNAELVPGEIREISVEVSSAFQAERLIIARRPQSRMQRFAAHVRHIPWALAITLGVALRKISYHRSIEELEELEELDEDKHKKMSAWPNWRAPWPSAPVQIISINTNEGKTTAGMPPIPSELFTTTEVSSFLTGMEAAHTKNKIVLTVRSVAKRPYKLQGSFIGKCLAGTSFHNP